jgi:hypothetical protein
MNESAHESTTHPAPRTVPRDVTLAAPLACPRCGTIDTPIIGPGTGPHHACALCRHCGTHIQWLSQYTPAEREMRRLASREEAMRTRPPSQAQLDFLRDLGDRDTPPTSMLAASRRIASFLRNEVEP